MIIADEIKEKLLSTAYGVVLTIEDFDIETENQPALVKALNRLVIKGELNKIAKGKYFKPKKTQFGILQPTASEVVKDFLEKNGKIVGYITGTAAFASMGLTTQITSAILVGSNKYRRPVMRGEFKVSFLLQTNPITEKNIPILRLLDAIRLIREIPATSPDESVAIISKLIKSLDIEQQRELCDLAEGYTQYVRALLGAIMENAGLKTFNLRRGLNGVTSYKLPVSDKILPNKTNWNIR